MRWRVSSSFSIASATCARENVATKQETKDVDTDIYESRVAGLRKRDPSSTAKSKGTPSGYQTQTTNRRYRPKCFETLRIQDQEVDGTAEHSHACGKKSCCNFILGRHGRCEKEYTAVYQLHRRKSRQRYPVLKCDSLT
jgi:hypothetical protein